MLKNISYLLVLSSILLVSCSAISPPPTATPLPTATQVPTDTPEPTSTPLPTATATMPPATPTQTSTPDLIPKGTPEKEWNGIKIMPGALAGEGDSGSYRFAIKATSAEIQSYYNKQMKLAGWTSFALGTGNTEASLMFFTKDTKTFTISIIPQDDLFIVMFVQ
jgi:hypothetical protein